jgi:hypothetical protein
MTLEATWSSTMRGVTVAPRLTRCPSCRQPMALRSLCDYGSTKDSTGVVIRVVWWECVCGHREVLAHTAFG